MKPLLPVAVLLAALVAGAAQAQPEGAPNRRSLSVSGEGEVSAKPDRARLELAVDVFNAELKAAETEVNRIVRAFLVEAKAVGAKDEHIGSAAVTVRPEYVWDEQTRANRLSGYRARRDIQLTVTELDKLGDFILRATRSGVNHVAPPRLESSRASELQREALVKATQDAQLTAQRLAETLGMRLGAIRKLQAAGQVAPPPYPMPKLASLRREADSAPAGNEELGLASGQIRYSASVTADFDLQLPQP